MLERDPENVLLDDGARLMVEVAVVQVVDVAFVQDRCVTAAGAVDVIVVGMGAHAVHRTPGPRSRRLVASETRSRQV